MILLECYCLILISKISVTQVIPQSPLYAGRGGDNVIIKVRRATSKERL